MADEVATREPETSTGGELRDQDLEISDNWDEITPTFDALGLSEDLLRGIYAYGFERPSAIQQVNLLSFCYYPDRSYFSLFILRVVESHQARSDWQGRHCTGPVW